jgi:hypothetical protein
MFEFHLLGGRQVGRMPKMVSLLCRFLYRFQAAFRVSVKTITCTRSEAAQSVGFIYHEGDGFAVDVAYCFELREQGPSMSMRIGIPESRLCLKLAGSVPRVDQFLDW